MKNFNKFAFFLLFSFVLFFSFLRLNSRAPKAYAQDANLPQAKSETIELSVINAYQPCEDPDRTDPPLCIPYPAAVANHPDPTKLDHELGLVTNNLPQNTDIYIVGCINTTQGARCTTGDASLDSMLNNIPGGDQMNPDPSYEFKALENPKKTDADGVLEGVIVRSFTQQLTSHYFNAYYIVQSVQNTPIPVGSSDDESLKLGTFSSVSGAPTAQPSGMARPTRRPWPTGFPNVRNMDNFDPRGRLFDAQSLEPIPNGEVTLLNQQKTLMQREGVTNPLMVKVNGEFNFFVPNGVYYLNFQKIPSSHSWPIEITTVNSNYVKAYFCDSQVKDENNKSVALYNKQYAINEQNKLVHCDVPLDPGTNPPFKSEVKTVDYGFYRTSSGQETVYSGKISHPLSKVLLKAEESNQTVISTAADKLGYWRITLNNARYPKKADGSLDRIVIAYKKVDLTKSIEEAEASTDTLTAEPILNSIEGYAYDNNNQIIPLASIGVRQVNTSKVSFVTLADDTGFFKIPSRYLPSFSYEIVYLNPNTKELVVSTTSRFTSNNDKYLKEKSVNLLTQVNQSVIVQPKINPFNQINASGNEVANDQSNQNITPVVSGGESISPLIKILPIIVILVILVIGLVFLVVKLSKPKETV